ncbi:MAG: asparagine synthase-related protein, partial [Anderseniella sp.]|nr:asparagine synthase-related protein [Anderseniella sp.]
QDAAASLVITFDGRIDNREELVRLLQASGCPPSADTDVEIALRAYQCWGGACAERILGDFAFAIWDGARNTLFCARDIFGTRPLYYHHRPGTAFTFASTPDALFAGGVVARQLNEARIADYLVSELEGIDKTSTFYQDVFRLPPAHTLTVSPRGMSITRYWKPEPGPELQLASDREYEEAFLETFREAVRCRLRGGDMVSSMLSGGLDSSSIVGVARALRLEAGDPPFRTYSVMSREPATCIETRAIHQMLKLDSLDPTTFSADQLPDLYPELAEQTWHLEEPFDFHMIVPRSLAILAKRQGVRVMLDGIDGDSVLSEGMFLPRLVRRGKLVTAWREATGLRQVYPGESPVGVELMNAMRAAFVPDWIRMGLRPLRRKQQWKQVLADSRIHPEFADRIHLQDRLETLNETFRARRPLDRDSDNAGTIDHPFIVCGVERYERVAAASSLESRHPFLDRRVVEFCMRLPDSQKIRNGWPKSILRRAMAGYLPQEVCSRRGKGHLSSYLTASWVKRLYPEISKTLHAARDVLAPYVQASALQESIDYYQFHGEHDAPWRLYELTHLANWLKQQKSKK